MKNRRETKRAWLAAAVTLAALGLSACASSGSQVSSGEVVKVQNVENSVISVAASEKVKAVPDMAEVMMRVHTEDTDARLCEDKSVETLEHVIEQLKEMGVEEKSIQTSGYGMNPVYDWSNGKTLTGYEMDVTVTVSDIKLEDAGSIISASVDAGVNDIRSVSYYSSQYDEKYQEALSMAVEAAKVKAEAIAQAGGITLGNISRVEESMPNMQARYSANAAMVKMEGISDSSGSSMPVMAGEIDIEADIMVEFEIVK